ncbi:S26 family signal peptidase [Novosphingobium sp. JCM 18896]|uniref:S26 family signal peptidase n=1 Tax=Novosphingobium sp. JCM 18896 TaxID=2989731 RepID=UPI002222AF55|nr:S26 family signal peptidase [Novosphingobium sp. JCM 18896]MCW1430879.1 S26 family signal peptidase [Novosphingobium sp. JCM 18896]
MPEEMRSMARAGSEVRSGILAASALAFAFLAVPPAARPSPVLLWNVTASVPTGLYSLGGSAAIERGDLVAARLPPRVRSLAAERRYVPASVPVIKRVAGVSGDLVCGMGAQVTVNGRTVAMRRQWDGARRLLPKWQGCERLSASRVFLLGDAPDSFDGRYFGVIESACVLGEASLLWRS